MDPQGSSRMDPIGSDGFLLVMMEPDGIDGSGCVCIGPDGFSLFLMGPDVPDRS